MKEGHHVDASDLLVGAIDMHVHAFPDSKPRLLDVFEATRAAAAAGMKGLVLKDHQTLTADRAWMVRQVVTGIDVWGGITLNRTVGGFNPYAVEAAINLGASVIWFPTQSAASHLRVRGQVYKDGLTIFTSGLDSTDSIRSDVKDILRQVADANIVLATGHLHADEVMALLPLARDCGVKKMVVTHPENPAVALSAEQCTRAVALGAYLEFCCRSFLSSKVQVSLSELVKLVRQIGTHHCILSSDLGDASLPAPIKGLKRIIHGLLEEGLTTTDVRNMTARNPCSLLSCPIP